MTANGTKPKSGDVCYSVANVGKPTSRGRRVAAAFDPLRKWDVQRSSLAIALRCALDNADDSRMM